MTVCVTVTVRLLPWHASRVHATDVVVGEYETMAHHFSCDQDPFEITSENRDELIEMVQQHAQNTHDMEMERSDIEEGMQET